MGVMHFARHAGRATVYALPGVETIEHVGTARGPDSVWQSIDCRTQLRKFVEVLQSKDLDQPLLAPSFGFDADGEPTPDLQMMGYLIDRPAQLERQRLEQAGLPQEVQFAQTVLCAVCQSVIVGEAAHLGIVGEYDLQHAAVDQIAPMKRLEAAQIAIALASVEAHHAVVRNDQTNATGGTARMRVPALEPYPFDPATAYRADTIAEEHGYIRRFAHLALFARRFELEPVAKEVRDLIHDLFCISLAADYADEEVVGIAAEEQPAELRIEPVPGRHGGAFRVKFPNLFFLRLRFGRAACGEKLIDQVLTFTNGGGQVLVGHVDLPSF